MEKSLVKISSLLFLSFFVFSFSSCKNDDDTDDVAGTIVTGQVLNGNQYNSTINKVRIVAPDASGNEVVLYKNGTFKDGSFKVVLPDAVPASALVPVSEALLQGASGFTISIPNAKVALTDFRAFNKDNTDVGSITYIDYAQNVNPATSTITQNEVYRWDVYADQDVSVNGSFSATQYSQGLEFYVTVSVNITLHKGWNIIYPSSNVVIYMDESEGTIVQTLSNTAPSGLKWQFIPIPTTNSAPTLTSVKKIAF
jgi:hypothetical protein